MDIVVLLLVLFLHDQPATATAPAIPAHAETKSYVLAGEAGALCDQVGQTMVSQLKQEAPVSHAGYACIPVHNPEDKPA